MRVGDYTVVTLMFVSHRTYDYTPLPAVTVAKDGVILASAVGADRVAFDAGNVVTHAETGIPVAKRLEYEIESEGARFVVTFDHRHDMSTLDFGTAGGYLRFTSDVSIEHHAANGVSSASGTTLWELPYFGDRTGAEPVAAPKALIGHQA